jgi:hypothetical protein
MNSQPTEDAYQKKVRIVAHHASVQIVVGKSVAVIGIMLIHLAAPYQPFIMNFLLRNQTP